MKPLHHLLIKNLISRLIFKPKQSLAFSIIVLALLFTIDTRAQVTKEVKDKLENAFRRYPNAEIPLEQFMEVNKHIYQKKAVDRPGNISNLSAAAALFPSNCNVVHSTCANGDFESGAIDMSQWRGAYGTWGSGDPNPFALTEGFSSGPITSSNAHQTIVGPGVDPVTGIHTVSPVGGNFALRLGNRVNGFGTELISKTIKVEAGRTIFPFYYALVFQDPGHAPQNQPAFSVRAFNCNGVELPPVCDLGNGSNKAVSDADNPFFQSAGGGSIAYKDWSVAQINLSAYIGQTITIVFLNKDCGLGGHYGYTYLDNLCTVCTSGCPYNISINQANTSTCGKGQICVDYSLPKTGGSVGDVTIDLDIYQNGVLLQTITSPTLTTEGAPYCFNVDPALPPIQPGEGGFDYIVTGRFSINNFSLSPLVVGQPPNGQVAGVNNDYLVSITTAVCKNATVSLVNGVAMVTPQDVDGGSTATCGIKSMSVAPSQFNCTNIGQNTVVLTITDNNGNTSSCKAEVTVNGTIPSCNIKAIPANNVYTGGIPTNIYLGYGPQSVTLDPQATGGSSFTYEWTPTTGLDNASSPMPTFTPTAPGTYTIEAKVTNESGCVSTCKIVICVIDIRVPFTDGKKVYVCHTPPGNPANVQTLMLSVNAVPAHIFNPGHGDRLGTCEQLPCGVAPPLVSSLPSGTTIREQQASAPLTMRLISASGSQNINLYISTGEKEAITLRLLDMYGRLVKTFNGITPNSNFKINENLTSGIYYVQAVQGKKAVSLKLNVMR